MVVPALMRKARLGRRPCGGKEWLPRCPIYSMTKQVFRCPNFLPAVAVSTTNYQQLLAPPVPRRPWPSLWAGDIYPAHTRIVDQFLNSPAADRPSPDSRYEMRRSRMRRTPTLLKHTLGSSPVLGPIVCTISGANCKCKLFGVN